MCAGVVDGSGLVVCCSPGRSAHVSLAVAVPGRGFVLGCCGLVSGALFACWCCLLVFVVVLFLVDFSGCCRIVGVLRHLAVFVFFVAPHRVHLVSQRCSGLCCGSSGSVVWVAVGVRCGMLVLIPGDGSLPL